MILAHNRPSKKFQYIFTENYILQPSEIMCVIGDHTTVLISIMDGFSFCFACLVFLRIVSTSTMTLTRIKKLFKCDWMKTLPNPCVIISLVSVRKKLCISIHSLCYSYSYVQNQVDAWLEISSTTENFKKGHFFFFKSERYDAVCVGKSKPRVGYIIQWLISNGMEGLNHDMGQTGDLTHAVTYRFSVY